MTGMDVTAVKRFFREAQIGSSCAIAAGVAAGRLANNGIASIVAGLEDHLQ